jgi:hypothetical protein
MQQQLLNFIPAQQAGSPGRKDRQTIAAGSVSAKNNMGGVLVD